MRDEMLSFQIAANLISEYGGIVNINGMFFRPTHVYGNIYKDVKFNRYITGEFGMVNLGIDVLMNCIESLLVHFFSDDLQINEIQNSVHIRL